MATFQVTGHLAFGDHRVQGPVNEGESVDDGFPGARAAVDEVTRTAEAWAADARPTETRPGAYEALVVVTIDEQTRRFRTSGQTSGDAYAAALEAMAKVRCNATSAAYPHRWSRGGEA